jgi:RNA polymerase sigma-70 factor, ECF subfamily
MRLGKNSSDKAKMEREAILNLSRVFGFEQTGEQRKNQELEETLVELYATMRTSLIGYAYQVVGSTGDSEDLVQVAFLKLFDHLKRESKILNVRSWLYRVVHNLAIDHVRRRGVHESAVAGWMAERTLSDKPTSAENELIQQQRVAGYMSLLNDRERECLTLRAEGLSYQEVGEVLGISHKAVSVYLVRGLKKVRGAKPA